MSLGFSCKSELYTHKSPGAEQLKKLPGAISHRTGLKYTIEETNDGCRLKPAFHIAPSPYRKSFQRNSFIPEIEISISRLDGQSCLNIKGKPSEYISAFVMLLFGFLLILELLLIVFAAFGGSGSLFIAAAAPVIIAVFAYVLCKTAVKYSFNYVVEIIREELL